jgi:conjugative transfer signal peptidase TraF
MTRFGYVMMTYLVTLGIGVTALFHPKPRLLWNASASVPTGLYALRPVSPLKDGDIVAAIPSRALSRYMAIRFYLPLGLPLIKHVGALPGQTVCRRGSAVSIDGRPVAAARPSDHLHRPLPSWQGCHRIAPDEVFLLNPAVPDSFDGRYFGVLPMASVMGRTVPLWTSRGQFP